MTGYANNDIRGQGSGHVNGEDWTARSEKFIPAGSRIRVLQRSGMILDVEPVNHE
jgi:membrane-bound ClpP family serine protease